MDKLGSYVMRNTFVRHKNEKDMLFLVLECPHSLKAEMKAIEYRGDFVNLKLESKDSAGAGLEDTYKVYDIRVLQRIDGNKMQMLFNRNYEKDKEIDQVKLRNHDCIVSIEKLDPDLFAEPIKEADDIYLEDIA